MYEYVGSSPHRWADPSGLLPGDPDWDVPVWASPQYLRDADGNPIGWAGPPDASADEERRALAEEYDRSLPDPPAPAPRNSLGCVALSAIAGGGGLVIALKCPHPAGKAAGVALGVGGAVFPLLGYCEEKPMTEYAPRLRNSTR